MLYRISKREVGRHMGNGEFEVLSGERMGEVITLELHDVTLMPSTATHYVNGKRLPIWEGTFVRKTSSADGYGFVHAYVIDGYHAGREFHFHVEELEAVK